MSAFAKILQAFLALLPSVFDWWQRTQAAKAQENAQKQAQNSVNSINANPGEQWMQRFGANAGPNAKPCDVAPTANPEQPNNNF